MKPGAAKGESVSVTVKTGEVRAAVAGVSYASTAAFRQAARTASLTRIGNAHHDQK